VGHDELAQGFGLYIFVNDAVVVADFYDIKGKQGGDADAHSVFGVGLFLFDFLDRGLVVVNLDDRFIVDFVQGAFRRRVDDFRGFHKIGGYFFHSAGPLFFFWRLAMGCGSH